MKNLVRGVVMVLLLAATAHAATTVLDPGPGTDYLAIWCGGQAVNEIATGFDASANAVTLVKVSTTCHGSGKGSPNQYYLACWTVTFGQDGTILSQVWLATNHWVQGNPPIPCPVTADPSATYTHEDGAGNFPATLSTTSLDGEYRAVLDTTCTAIHLDDAASGTIDTPGAQACYSFSGSTDDGIQVGVVQNSGDLVPVAEVRRPDGTVLCTTGSGAADCTLDASGLHTIVVGDQSGAGTGGYDLTLTCLTPSCGAVPHLTIDMTGTLSGGNLVRTLTYQVTVGNDGRNAADNVVLDDTVPQGLFVRSLSSTQGTCSHVQRAVTCALGSVPPSGSVVVTITTVTALQSGQVTNTACVDTDTCATTVTDLSKPDVGSR